MDLSDGAVLLLALSAGPGWSVELIARVKARSRGIVRLHTGDTNRLLLSLQAKGLVRGWSRPTGSRGRPRLYYELTPAGIAEAERAREIVEGLLRPGYPEPSPGVASRMAERVAKAGNLSVHALEFRRAALNAGIP